MNAAVAVFVCLLIYWAAYRFYASFLARSVFALDPREPTPAHALQDGYDYVPAQRFVLFGHHYASITGLSPMLGPAIAVIWGWVPALFWVVFGATLIGCVHDFSSLCVSLRAKGMSIGKVAEGVLGPRAKTLFHLIIFFLIALAMGVFVHVIALLFSTEGGVAHPESVVPSAAILVAALVIGFLVYKKGMPWGPATAAGFLVTVGFIFVGGAEPIITLLKPISADRWKLLLCLYAFAASALPVWLLLQPRDYINALYLVIGLSLMYLGLFVVRPSFSAPPFIPRPEGAPPIFPFVFIIIACGAVSGFHSLVSSGTTAKQLNTQGDARFIGYGGMIGESLLGLMAVVACTAGAFSSKELWLEHYGTWERANALGPQIGAFIQGAANFIQAVGFSETFSVTFTSVVVVSFALTTLDSGTRLLRYNLEEIGETLSRATGSDRLTSVLGNPWITSGLAASIIAFFAFKAGLPLWALFGTTNQLLAGLALLAVTVYLFQRRKPLAYTLIPMVFVVGTTMIAMGFNIMDFAGLRGGETKPLLLSIGVLLFALAVWLCVEAVAAFIRAGRKAAHETMQVF